MHDELATPNRTMASPSHKAVGKKCREKANRPSDDVYEQSIVLIERIFVGGAAPRIENFVVDPRKTTQPPIFLELM